MPRGTIATEAIPVLPAAGAPAFAGLAAGDGGAGDGAAEAAEAAAAGRRMSGGGGPECIDAC